MRLWNVWGVFCAIFVIIGVVVIATLTHDRAGELASKIETFLLTRDAMSAEHQKVIAQTLIDDFTRHECLAK